MKRLIREPLVHFFLLGAALFALYGWLNREGFNAPDEIVVSRGQVRNLSEQFGRVWQRAPTQEELQGLIDGWVREEIFYREALAMGLDRDDPVVRRRMTQKVQFIIDGATPAAPTTEELQPGWMSTRRSTPSSRRIHCDRSTSIQGARRAIWRSILPPRAGRLTAASPWPATPSMLPSTLTAASASEVVRTFGSYFERELRGLAGRELARSAALGVRPAFR